MLSLYENDRERVNSQIVLVFLYCTRLEGSVGRTVEMVTILNWQFATFPCCNVMFLFGFITGLWHWWDLGTSICRGADCCPWRWATRSKSAPPSPNIYCHHCRGRYCNGWCPEPTWGTLPFVGIVIRFTFRLPKSHEKHFRLHSKSDAWPGREQAPAKIAKS